MNPNRAANNLYKSSLSILRKQLGTSATYSTDLDKIGKHLFDVLWRGVFASDQDIPKTGYAIINVDKSDESGSHWVAICDGIVYDSFGRKIKNLIPHLKNIKDIVDNDAEQTKKQEDCGQRCLAFIWVYHRLGKEYALFI